MTQYRVQLQQYVEMTATVDVEADTVEAAKEIALTDLAPSANWSLGDDVYDLEIYAVYQDDEPVWER